MSSKIPQTNDDQKRVRDYLGELMNNLSNDKFFQTKETQEEVDKKIEDIKRLMKYLGLDEEMIRNLIVTNPPDDGLQYIRMGDKWCSFRSNIPENGNPGEYITRNAKGELEWIHPLASYYEYGFVKVDNKTIYSNSEGVLSAKQDHADLENLNMRNAHPATSILAYRNTEVNTVQGLLDDLFLSKLTREEFQYYQAKVREEYEVHKQNLQNLVDGYEASFTEYKDGIQEQIQTEHDAIYDKIKEEHDYSDNTYETKEDYDKREEKLLQKIHENYVKLDDDKASRQELSDTKNELLESDKSLDEKYSDIIDQLNKELNIELQSIKDNYTLIGHSHTIADVNNLQEEFDKVYEAIDTKKSIDDYNKSFEDEQNRINDEFDKVYAELDKKANSVAVSKEVTIPPGESEEIQDDNIENYINRNVKILVKDNDENSRSYNQWINSEGVATLAYLDDKFIVYNDTDEELTFKVIII